MSAAVSKRSARAIADVMEGTILATVEIAAPPERVFRAITDPKEIPKWWGSDDLYRTEECTSDLRVGGKWTSRGHGADGTAFGVEGEYVEIDPPRKLVQTWKAPWDGNNVTTITYRLDAIEGGTRVTVKHAGFADRHDSCRSHGDGWERVLGWLESFTKSESSTFFFCRMIPPRPSFAMDMSEKERNAMLAHAAYWTEQLASGTAVVFGPVRDPAGVWGLGIVRARDEEHLAELWKNDPVIKAGLGLTWEAHPLISTLTRA